MALAALAEYKNATEGFSQQTLSHFAPGCVWRALSLTELRIEGHHGAASGVADIAGCSIQANWLNEQIEEFLQSSRWWFLFFRRVSSSKILPWGKDHMVAYKSTGV